MSDYLCGVCALPIDETPHSLPDGEDCHPSCCPGCTLTLRSRLGGSRVGVKVTLVRWSETPAGWLGFPKVTGGCRPFLYRRTLWEVA